ncbi:MAG TPA: FIST N-terminal domain-containing protein [Candidatus Norongarragalinales archaeon]|nr:FIST N-terminal domain-containing protein [Candidatus Norongarragalinales archaeon]
MGKYISVGVGTSFNSEPFKAGKEAAEASLKNADAKKGTFSIAFVDSRYSNPEKILEGINSVLGKAWIGCSVDRQFNDEEGYIENKAVTVTTIVTEYMHFGVGYVNNYRSDPADSGKKAIQMAISNIKIDQYIDPYIQFRRTKTKTFADIVRTPPYFILTIPSGTYFENKQVVMGRETEFIEGILDVTGASVPIFGFVSNSDFDKFMKEGVGDNFQFADGKLLQKGGICVFVVSNLYFSHGLAHGYITTDKYAMITKLDPSGHIVKEINGKPSVDEYCRLVGIKKEEFLKDPYKYTLTRSIAVIDSEGENYIKAMGTTPDGKYLFSQAKLAPRSGVGIVTFDKKTVLSGIVEAMDKANKNLKDKVPAIVLAASCSARRAVLGADVPLEIKAFKKAYRKVPCVGFFTFGEIGSNKNKACQLNEQTITLLTIYDDLITE